MGVEAIFGAHPPEGAEASSGKEGARVRGEYVGVARGAKSGLAGTCAGTSNPAPAFATYMCTLFCVFFKRHK